jgi:AcrR family transcriptional regulator
LARRGRPEATATREAIVRACLVAIATDGFHALRIRRVAEQAGVSHATLLHHFPSKVALIGAVLDAVEEELATRGPAPPFSSPVQALHSEFVDAARRLADRPEEFAVSVELLHAARHSPAVASLTARLYSGWRQAIREIVEEGQGLGLFRLDVPPEAVAEVVTATLAGISMTAFSHASGASTDHVLQAAWDGVSSWLRVGG